ncbi:hypothetical protein PC111_g18535 [Phytophthora cactorum]|nr:hypothetical protein PC111_g18535 [Phytophthora cactorum]
MVWMSLEKIHAAFVPVVSQLRQLIHVMEMELVKLPAKLVNAWGVVEQQSTVVTTLVMMMCNSPSTGVSDSWAYLKEPSPTQYPEPALLSLTIYVRRLNTQTSQARASPRKVA